MYSTEPPLPSPSFIRTLRPAAISWCHCYVSVQLSGVFWDQKRNLMSGYGWQWGKQIFWCHNREHNCAALRPFSEGDRRGVCRAAWRRLHWPATMTEPLPFSEEAVRRRGVESAAAALGFLHTGNVHPPHLEELLALHGDEGEHVLRCLGIMLGTACGDILGANLEFRTRQEIVERHGEGPITTFLHSFSRPRGFFTDDTEMTIALAQALVNGKGHANCRLCAEQYVEFFARPPQRGYGPGTTKVLKHLDDTDCSDARTSGSVAFPTGSFGNGSCMRIAPLGAVYRNATVEVQRAATVEACLSTHSHEEAIEAAFVMVLASSRALLRNADEAVTKAEALALIEEMRAATTCMELQAKLDTVIAADAEEWDDMEAVRQFVTNLGFGDTFAIRAVDAVACVMWGFLRYGSDPLLCLGTVVSWGGDADTVGAILGALLGARYGISWIPDKWYSQVENAYQQGRDLLVDLALKIAQFDTREMPPTELQ